MTEPIDAYELHLRRLRGEPADDGSARVFTDRDGILHWPGGFFTVVDGESGQPEAGRDDWPHGGRTPAEQLAWQRRIEGYGGDK